MRFRDLEKEYVNKGNQELSRVLIHRLNIGVHWLKNSVKYWVAYHSPDPEPLLPIVSCVLPAAADANEDVSGEGMLRKCYVGSRFVVGVNECAQKRNWVG